MPSHVLISGGQTLPRVSDIYNLNNSTLDLSSFIEIVFNF